jgi:membrane peptidoglycan carboxypeptidase
VTTPSRWARIGTGIKTWFTDASLGQWFKRFVLAGLGSVVMLLLFLLWAYSAVELPSEPARSETTIIRDAKGNQIAELYKGENRIEVPLNRVADVLEHAVIATEDRKFYEHGGVDPVGTARAFLNDVRGRQLQGGSTITQQLVKNTYLTSERSLSRKFKEAILAVKVERELDKRTILARYLNTIYYGRGAYGIETAAELYFGTTAAQLNLEQAALLAGLIRAPESADPLRHPEEATRRRAIVLDAMVRADYINSAQARDAKAKPLGAIPQVDPNRRLSGRNAYFAAMVQDWTVKQFGEKQALTGGLRVDTTLDPDLQAAAEGSIKAILDRPDDPDAALVSMNNDGAIVAMIGGKDFQQSSVNLAIDNNKARGKANRPQAGSTFKPIVLAAALEQGIPLSTRYAGPPTLRIDFGRPGAWEYPNYNRAAYGELDLTQATASSVNTIYGQLARDTGLDRIVETAKDLGIDSEVNPYPAMPLGTANISPLEMLRAYMTFANRGRRPVPYFVKRVTDARGRVLYEADVDRESVYPPKYADIVNYALSQVIERGTGTAARIGRDAAGKTGTTDEYTDAWFVGYTPRIGTAVWLGYPNGTEHKMTNVHGIAVAGGTFPTRIWQRFMAVAVKDKDTGRFVKPDELLMNPPTTTTTSSSTSSTTSSTTTTTTKPTTTTTKKPTTTTTKKPPTTTSSTTTSTTTEPP